MKTTLGTPNPRWDWHRKMLLRLRPELSAARTEHETAVRAPHERGGTGTTAQARTTRDHVRWRREHRLERNRS